MAQSDDEREERIRAECLGTPVHLLVKDMRFILSRLYAARAERDEERARAERYAEANRKHRTFLADICERMRGTSFDRGFAVANRIQQEIGPHLRMTEVASPPPPPSPNGARSAEEPFTPDYAEPPGGTIKDILEERGIHRFTFEEQMGMSSADFDRLFVGDMRIDASLARRLERVLGSTAQFWMTRDAQYVADLARLQKTVTPPRSAEEERADVVAYLHSGYAHLGACEQLMIQTRADAIELGRHVGAATKGGVG